MYYIINKNLIMGCFLDSTDDEYKSMLAGNPTYTTYEHDESVTIHEYFYCPLSKSLVNREHGDYICDYATMTWTKKTVEIKIQETRLMALQAINSHAKRQRLIHIPDAATAELLRAKVIDAQTCLSVEIPTESFVNMEATIKGISVNEMANRIMAKHNTMLDEFVAIEKLRIMTKQQLVDAKTIKQIATIMDAHSKEIS